MSDHEFEELRSLGDATRDLAPTAGFADAVMNRLEVEVPPSLPERVERQGRWAVLAAAAVAAACLVLAIQAQTQLDEEVIADVDMVEVLE